MERKTPSQVPNGSAGVDTRPPAPPATNGDGKPQQTLLERQASAGEPVMSIARTAEPDGRHTPEEIVQRSSSLAGILWPALDAVREKARACFAASVRQATGRPIGVTELWRTAQELSRGPGRAEGEHAEREAGYSVVVVERDDTLPAIFGKLDAAALPEVAVLVPRGNHELSTDVGARLLLRHAGWAGKEIVLVTRRPAVRQVAHAEGLRYVGNLHSVPFARGRERRWISGFDLPVPALSTVIALLVIAGVLAVGLFAALWYLPSATITLYPPTAPVSADRSVTIDPVANNVDTVNNVVPGDRRSTKVSRTIFIPTTGSADVQQTAGDPITAQAVSDADLKAAQDMASAALSDAAVQQLSQRDGGAWMYFPTTAKVDVESVTPQQKAGAVTPFLQVTYTGSASILGAKQSDLRALLLTGLRGKIPAGKQVIDSSEHLSIERSGPYDITADSLPLQVRLDAATTNRIDIAKIQRAVRGKSRRQALAYAVKAVDGVRAPKLQLSPSWIPWLPHVTNRVKVELSDGS